MDFTNKHFNTRVVHSYNGPYIYRTNYYRYVGFILAPILPDENICNSFTRKSSFIISISFYIWMPIPLFYFCCVNILFHVHEIGSFSLAMLQPVQELQNLIWMFSLVPLYRPEVSFSIPALKILSSWRIRANNFFITTPSSFKIQKIYLFSPYLLLILICLVAIISLHLK